MKKKITGVSSAVGGISWDSEIEPKDRWKHLFLFLESKRILVNPAHMEIADHCIQSVLKIKDELVETTKDIDFNNKDMDSIRILIDSCNSFLDSVNSKRNSGIIYKKGNAWSDYEFDKAMKSFRGSFRDVISEVSKIHKIKFNKDIPFEY